MSMVDELREALDVAVRAAARSWIDEVWRWYPRDTDEQRQTVRVQGEIAQQLAGHIVEALLGDGAVASAVLVTESRDALVRGLNAAAAGPPAAGTWGYIVDTLILEGAVRPQLTEGALPNPILASFMRDVAEREGSWDPAKLLASWTNYVTNPPQLTSAYESHTAEHVAEARAVFATLTLSLASDAQEVPRG